VWLMFWITLCIRAFKNSANFLAHLVGLCFMKSSIVIVWVGATMALGGAAIGCIAFTIRWIAWVMSSAPTLFILLLLAIVCVRHIFQLFKSHNWSYNCTIKIRTKHNKQLRKRNTISSLPTDPKYHFENLCSDTKCNITNLNNKMKKY